MLGLSALLAVAVEIWASTWFPPPVLAILGIFAFAGLLLIASVAAAFWKIVTQPPSLVDAKPADAVSGVPWLWIIITTSILGGLAVVGFVSNHPLTVPKISPARIVASPATSFPVPLQDQPHRVDSKIEAGRRLAGVCRKLFIDISAFPSQFESPTPVGNNPGNEAAEQEEWRKFNSRLGAEFGKKFARDLFKLQQELHAIGFSDKQFDWDFDFLEANENSGAMIYNLRQHLSVLCASLATQQPVRSGKSKK